MPHPLLSELINGCTPGDRVCLLPISRVLVEDAEWLTPGTALFPPDTLAPADLRVVEWPARSFESLRRGIDAGGIALSGDNLHWAKSAATNIDLPDFFGSALLAFTTRLNWDAFLSPESHEAHLEMVRTEMEKCERIFDLVRFEQCNLWTPQKLFVSAGLAGGLVWQSASGTIVPWVVQVDKLGQAQTVAPASADYRPTDPQIAWHLARFIEQTRAIPADPIVLRQNWLAAYDYTTDQGALALNDYARVNDPFAKVGETQVAVDVSSVIRASPNSFRVAWVERRYADGALAATERWTAILTITIQTPRDPDRLKKNPLGVYVHALNWSKELG